MFAVIPTFSGQLQKIYKNEKSSKNIWLCSLKIIFFIFFENFAMKIMNFKFS